eukprot:2562277-Amphidinium_carterae.2
MHPGMQIGFLDLKGFPHVHQHADHAIPLIPGLPKYADYDSFCIPAFFLGIVCLLEDTCWQHFRRLLEDSSASPVMTRRNSQTTPKPQKGRVTQK